jgi:hypothetical protein
VRPFEDVWKYLLSHQHSCASDAFVFPQFDDPSKMWFHKLHQTETKCALTKVLAKALKKAGVKGNHFGQRLRRWWSTAMQQNGYGQFEQYMGGHDEKTANQYYIEREQVVRAAKIGRALK